MAKPLGQQMKEHKTELVVGAIGLLGAVVLYMRSRSTSTSASTTGTTTSTTSLTGTSVATTTGTDAYNGLEDQILGLQQALLGLKTGGGASTSTSKSLPQITKPATTVVGDIPAGSTSSSSSPGPIGSGGVGEIHAATPPSTLAVAKTISNPLLGAGDDKTGTRNKTMGIPIADVTSTMLEPTATGKYEQTKPTAIANYYATSDHLSTALQSIDASKAA